MVDFALARGIACLTGVLPDAFRKEVLAMGWAAAPLGPAVRVDSGLVGAFAPHIRPDTPDRLCWVGPSVGQARSAAACARPWTARARRWPAPTIASASRPP